MFLDPTASTPHLDAVDKVVRIVGLPAIFAGIIWLVRTFDASQRQWKDIDTNSKAAFETASTIKSQVDVLQNNHMAHMEVELKSQTALLASVDKNIAIIADRTPRTVEVTTKINHIEV
jgi:hypothetical protein